MPGPPWAHLSMRPACHLLGSTLDRQASTLSLCQAEGAELWAQAPQPLPSRRSVQGCLLSVLASLTPCMTRGSFIT